MARVFKEEKKVENGGVAWGCAAPEDSRPPVSQSVTRFKAPRLLAEVAEPVVRKPVRVGENEGVNEIKYLW